jgi:hypothetical protein
VTLVVDDIDASLVHVEASLSRFLILKTGLGEMDPGFTTWIEDTEGKRLGIYGKPR